MKAALQHRHGGPEVLAIADLAAPQPGANEVLVRVKAAAVNRLDYLQLGRPILPGFRLPHIGGLDFAGDVIATGPNVDGYDLGTRVVVDPQVVSGTGREVPVVLGGNSAGGFAELCVVPTTNLYRLGDAMPYHEAAALPTAYATAWRALFGTGGLRSGQWLLIHGAGSALTLAALQLAAGKGAHVIISGRGRAKLDRAERLGATVTADSITDDTTRVVREATNGQGVDLVFDHVGATTLATSLHSLRPGGTLVVAGNTSGDHAQLPSLAALFHKGISIKGAGPYSRGDFAAALDTYQALSCIPVIDTVGTLKDLPTMYERLSNGRTNGKLLITP